MANSAGTFQNKLFHFEMVRPGMALYGLNPMPGEKNPMKPVVSLRAPVLQLKTAMPGETIGYGATYRFESKANIAIVSVGYADGFLRLAGGGRFGVMLHGHRAPTLGNVCMDMTMIDVTQIPEARVGDEVTIFGENPPVEELAVCLQTIPYEVFTNISERVKRVYWQE